MGEYDGIQERQEGKAKMPFGMTLLFLGLIACGLCYLYLYSPLTTGWTQADQYRRGMEAQKTAIITHETKEIETGAVEAGAAKDGAAIYKADCAACHGEKLEGGIGPALTGPAFIYGKTLADHVRVISDGTPKGMPGYAKQLGPERVRAVAHYIYFRHTK